MKSFILAALSALALLFPKSDEGIKEIAKPHLGVYECKQANLGSKDILEEFSCVQLELKGEDTFVIVYQKKDGEKNRIEGKYHYDRARKRLVMTTDRGDFKREFPLEEGKLTVFFPVVGKLLVLQFEQK